MARASKVKWPARTKDEEQHPVEVRRVYTVAELATALRARALEELGPDWPNIITVISPGMYEYTRATASLDEKILN